LIEAFFESGRKARFTGLLCSKGDVEGWCPLSRTSMRSTKGTQDP
jgi:hypothetical protein